MFKDLISGFKGMVGEGIVNFSAKLWLDKEKYHLIKNVTLPTADGSTQIDHVIVSIYGIFVIETKNMEGWIFGNPDHEKWTQTIYKCSYKFQNPLKQNYKHVKALQALLGITNDPIFLLVIFIGDSTFKTEMPENVTQGIDFIRYIKSKTRPILSKLDVSKIINSIENVRIKPSFKTNREHVRHVKDIVNQKENSSSHTCPRCGNSMVLRKTKKGESIGKKFWGCSKFPKCRCIVNVT